MSTIDCQGARALLMPYLDSELDAATTQRVNEHLLRCGSCSERYAAEQLLDAGIAALAAAPEPLPADVAARLERTLLAARDEAGAPPSAPRAARRAPPLVAGRPARRGGDGPARRRRPWPLLATLSAAAAVVVAALLSLGDEGRPAESIPADRLAREMLALHRGTVVPASAPRARAHELLAALHMSDLSLPGDGVLGGHPLRLVGARSVQLSGLPAVQLDFSCCDRPATVFVLPRAPGAALPAAPLPVDAQGRPAVLEGFHSWGLLDERAYVGILSDHDVSALVPALSI